MKDWISKLIKPAIFIILGILLGSVATIAAQSAEIQACVSNSNGSVRIVSSSADCRNNETYISWNMQGPKGDKGDPGPQGEQGPPGEPAELVAQNCPTGSYMYGINGDGIIACNKFESALGHCPFGQYVYGSNLNGRFRCMNITTIQGRYISPYTPPDGAVLTYENGTWTPIIPPK